VLLPFFVLSLLFAGVEQDNEVRLVRDWMSAVTAHQPGTVDQPLLDLAALAPNDINTVRRALRDALKKESVPVRNDILRRGALAHTDIALLLPDRAAEYLQTGQKEPVTFEADVQPKTLQKKGEDAVVFVRDGEFQSTAVETAHWSTARGLLSLIVPQPSKDEFVRLWYRAVAAYFEGAYLFGNARYHLARVQEVVPGDPLLLFYAGIVHEAYGSERIQSVFDTLPSGVGQAPAARPEEQWRRAEVLFEQAVKANGPAEARIRRARVLGLLGRHSEAVALLRDVQPLLTEQRLRYLGALFLGTEEGALGRMDEARVALERAASLCPTAQSPLIALAELARRAGDRATALAMLDRVRLLPPDSADRDDPWTYYFRAFAADAPEQLAAVRAWVERKAPR
jgi:tetratricopeptide (TPR) repeat protein